MKSTRAINMDVNSSGYLAMEKVCNKVLDPIQFPETFEGKIPSQQDNWSPQ